PVEAAHRPPVPAPWLRRRDAGRGRGLPPDAARRRRALHQLLRRPRFAARVLPALRLHRHRPGHVGRERPRARPRGARLTGIRASVPRSRLETEAPGPARHRGGTTCLTNLHYLTAAEAL